MSRLHWWRAIMSHVNLAYYPEFNSQNCIPLATPTSLDSSNGCIWIAENSTHENKKYLWSKWRWWIVHTSGFPRIYFHFWSAVRSFVNCFNDLHVCHVLYMLQSLVIEPFRCLPDSILCVVSMIFTERIVNARKLNNNGTQLNSLVNGYTTTSLKCLT